MRGVMILLAGWLISPPTGPMETLADQLLSGEIDPAVYDYGAIRFDAADEAAGWGRLQALERAVSGRAAPSDVEDGARLDIEAAGCAVTAVLGGARLAKRAPDRRAYDDARQAAVAHRRRAQADLDARLAGMSEPLEAALVRDQFWRDHMLQPRDSGLSAFAAEFDLDMLYRGLCEADQENAAFLRDLLSDEDQFFETIYGADHPERHALVQHAPTRLQRQVLSRMQSAPTFGDDGHERRAQAFLTDRVRLADRLPQIYATQGRCVQGRWVYAQPVDLDAAEERRAAVGIEPLDQARVRQDASCRARLGASR